MSFWLIPLLHLAGRISNSDSGCLKTVILHVQLTGMRIVVHAPGTLPNINENGINILPGQSTSLRVAMNKINHIDDPYSSCYDPPNPRSNTTLQTDLNSCRRMCLDKIIARNCSCEYNMNDKVLLLDRKRRTTRALACPGRSSPWSRSREHPHLVWGERVPPGQDQRQDLGQDLGQDRWQDWVGGYSPVTRQTPVKTLPFPSFGCGRWRVLTIPHKWPYLTGDLTDKQRCQKGRWI